jgi:hypothetical protein
MSLSIGNSSMNYTALGEVWDNYKYPPQKEFSYTGYDHFNECGLNDDGQPRKPIEQPVLRTHTNSAGQIVDTDVAFEGFQAHPSTSKVDTQPTYDHQPYNKDDKYSSVDAYNHMRSNQNHGGCDEYIEHVDHCKTCYDHLRVQMMNMNHEQNGKKRKNNLIFGMTYTNIAEIAVLVIGFAFVLFVMDVMWSTAKKFRRD